MDEWEQIFIDVLNDMMLAQSMSLKAEVRQNKIHALLVEFAGLIECNVEIDMHDPVKTAFLIYKNGL